MDIFWPLVISSMAVFITLLYTSYLDIRDRRVPFVHWMPMLAVGICCTSFLLWQTTADAGLVTGYLALVVSFLYADYLDNRGRTDSLYLTAYYRKANIWGFLVLTLTLPALSWFVLSPPASIPMILLYFLFAGVFIAVSFMEYQGRFEEDPAAGVRRTAFNEITGRWYFLLIIMVFAMGAVIMLFSKPGWGISASIVLFLAVFCGIFYTFGRMHLFGGADAWALIFIAFCVPVFPVEPVFGTPPLGFLAFSVLINALLLNLVTPVGIFCINIIRQNKAPLMYLFFGFPVQGDRIQEAWGFVMEDFYEKDGIVQRKFIGFWDAIRRMYSGTSRIYTKDLREHPDEFQDELSLYKRAGTVWISYAVPFIIPLTAGFATAVLLGDILLAIMNVLV